MTTLTVNCAQIENGNTKVFNVIVMNQEFKLDGYFFITIKDGIRCEPGNYYNSENGFFYEESSFSNISGSTQDSEFI